MTTLDTELRQAAVDLAAELGLSVVLRDVQEGAFDPQTGKTGTATTLTQTVNAAPPADYRTFEIDGELVKAGDQRLYVPAQGLAWPPAVGHDVQVPATTGAWWRVEAVQQHWSGAQVALYELQLRKA